MKKAIFSILPLLLLVTPSYAGYSSIECSSESVFVENSCTACYN